MRRKHGHPHKQNGPSMTSAVSPTHTITIPADAENNSSAVMPIWQSKAFDLLNQVTKKSQNGGRSWISYPHVILGILECLVDSKLTIEEFSAKIKIFQITIWYFVRGRTSSGKKWKILEDLIKQDSELTAALLKLQPTQSIREKSTCEKSTREQITVTQNSKVDESIQNQTDDQPVSIFVVPLNMSQTYYIGHAKLIVDKIKDTAKQSGASRINWKPYVAEVVIILECHKLSKMFINDFASSIGMSRSVLGHFTRGKNCGKSVWKKLRSLTAKSSILKKLVKTDKPKNTKKESKATNTIHQNNSQQVPDQSQSNQDLNLVATRKSGQVEVTTTPNVTNVIPVVEKENTALFTNAVKTLKEGTNSGSRKNHNILNENFEPLGNGNIKITQTISFELEFGSDEYNNFWNGIREKMKK